MVSHVRASMKYLELSPKHGHIALLQSQLSSAMSALKQMNGHFCAWFTAGLNISLRLTIHCFSKMNSVEMKDFEQRCSKFFAKAKKSSQGSRNNGLLRIGEILYLRKIEEHWKDGSFKYTQGGIPWGERNLRGEKIFKFYLAGTAEVVSVKAKNLHIFLDLHYRGLEAFSHRRFIVNSHYQLELI